MTTPRHHIVLCAFQLPNQSDGGLESATSIFEALREDYDWTLVTTRETDFTERWRAGNARVIVTPFEDSGFRPAKALNYARWAARIFAAARAARADCIHANDHRAFNAASLPARLLRLPLLLTVRDTKAKGEIYGRHWHSAARQCHRIITLSKWLADNLGFVTFFKVNDDFGTSLGVFPSSTFVAGVIVSLMVIPICTSVMREVFGQAPPGEREGAMALGGTRWGVVRDVVLPFGQGGIIGGSMLGLGRALGETIAVTLIISPSFDAKWSIVEQGSNSIAALIALKFSESTETGISALMAAGLALFIITLLVNTAASSVVNRSRSGSATEI